MLLLGLLVCIGCAPGVCCGADPVCWANAGASAAPAANTEQAKMVLTFMWKFTVLHVGFVLRQPVTPASPLGMNGSRRHPHPFGGAPLARRKRAGPYPKNCHVHDMRVSDDNKAATRDNAPAGNCLLAEVCRLDQESSRRRGLICEPVGFEDPIERRVGGMLFRDSSRRAFGVRRVGSGLQNVPERGCSFPVW